MKRCPMSCWRLRATGKPIVSTDVGGASTAIDKDKSGLIVPNDGDSAKLANAMVESADPTRYRQLSEAALSRMANFSMGQMIDKTEAVYRRLATAR